MDELQQKVVDAVDEDFLVKTTMELVDIPSPTGYEEDAARYMHAKYEEAGFEAHLQKVAEGRYNAVGISPGTGGGYSVMFNGHLDTSYSGEEPELTQPGYKNKAIRDGDWIIGNGGIPMATVGPFNAPSVRTLRAVGLRYAFTTSVAMEGPFRIPPQMLGSPLPDAEVYDFYPRWAMNRKIRPRP